MFSILMASLLFVAMQGDEPTEGTTGVHKVSAFGYVVFHGQNQEVAEQDAKTKAEAAIKTTLNSHQSAIESLTGWHIVGHAITEQNIKITLSEPDGIAWKIRVDWSYKVTFHYIIPLDPEDPEDEPDEPDNPE